MIIAVLRQNDERLHQIRSNGDEEEAMDLSDIKMMEMIGLGN